MKDTVEILENNLKLKEGVEYIKYEDLQERSNIGLPSTQKKKVLLLTSFEHKDVSFEMLEENNGSRFQDCSHNLHNHYGR